MANMSNSDGVTSTLMPRLPTIIIIIIITEIFRVA